MTLAGMLQSEAVDGERRAASSDRLAAELDREAATLQSSLDDVVRAFTDDVWRGPAAERSRERLHSGRARLRAAAAELARVAALLRRRAGDERAQALVLRRRAEQAAADERVRPAVPAG